MSKFDPVRKKIKRKSYRTHFLYSFLFVLILSVGFIIGSLIEKRNLDELHRLGSKYNFDVTNLKTFILNQSDSIHEYRDFIKSLPIGKPTDSMIIVSNFGRRIDPIDSIPSFHNGIDLNVKLHEPIFATGDGTVILSKWFSGYGKCVIIEHGFGFKSLYAHLSKINVDSGATVLKKDTIGFAGQTGRASGVHLHYEVIKINRQDPKNFIYETFGEHSK